MVQQVAAFYHSDDEAVFYTPSVAVVAGDIVFQNGLCGIAKHAIAANTQGKLDIEGVFRIPKTTAAWVVGLAVYWNATGDPDNGTAGSGAANQLGNGLFMGIASIAAASGDDYGYVIINTRPAYGFSARVPVATVAAAGTNAATAGVLVEGLNVVSAADDTKGVVLPPAVAGMQVMVKSTVSNKILKVYPATGDGINAIAVDTAMSLASGPTPTIFVAADATTWYTWPLLPS